MKDKIQSYLKSMLSSFHGYDKDTPIGITLTIDEITCIEQLLSNEPDLTKLRQMLLEIFHHEMGDFKIEHYVTAILNQFANQST